MLVLELIPTQPPRAGHALLKIGRWKGGRDAVLMSIQENQSSDFLGEGGEWAGHEMQHALPSLTEDGETCTVALGPEIVDSLVTQQAAGAALRVTLSDSGARQVGGLRLQSGVMSSQARGHARTLETLAQSTPEPEPKPESVEALEPAPAVDPAPDKPEPPVTPPTPEPASTRKWGVIGALVAILFVVMAAALWFWWHQPTPEPQGGCAVSASPVGNSTAFVQQCLATKPESSVVQATIDEAKQAGRCDVAQRLYAYKSQGGDNAIALRYAREFDPHTTPASYCFMPDAETAVYWYELILQRDAGNTEAKAALQTLGH